MKPYQFNGQMYSDLNSLGLAFKDNYDLAMESVTNKEFLRFVKQFKTSYKNISQYLETTRYLQNTVSFVVYEFTGKLVIFGKEYGSLQAICRDVDTKHIQTFASEKGFSKTICKHLDDKKLKNDLISYEKYNTDEIAIGYLKEYYKYVTIENTNEINRLLVSSEELFKRSIELFKNKEFLILVCHLYSLEEVMEIVNDSCPVFKGLALMELEFSKKSANKILNNGYYLWILDHIYDYKYLGSDAKSIKRDVIRLKKKISNPKNTFKSLCLYHKDLYNVYLEFANLYQDGKIIVKENESFGLNIFYCDTYISQDYISKNTVNLNKKSDKKAIITETKENYSLDLLDKTIKQHMGYGTIGIILSLVFILYIVLDHLLSYFNMDVDLFIYTLDDKYLPIIVYGCGVFVLLVMSIVFICKAKKDYGRYNKLCKLKFYRKNPNLSNEADNKRFDDIQKNEMKLVNSIDKYYPLFGGFANCGLSILVSFVFYSLVNYYGEAFFGFDVSLAFSLPYIYLVIIPACMCLLFGFLKHKKTIVSHIITFILSLVVCAGIIYLVSIGFIS